MKPTLVGGIDPGLVHTGCVSMLFVPAAKKIVIRHEVIAGLNTQAMAANFAIRKGEPHVPRRIFVEQYRPRLGFSTDVRMVEGQAEIKAVFGSLAKVIPNTSIKKIVKQPLMELLGVWKFSTPTHHQDLRSAARIALLGMMKDDGLNALLYKVTSDHLEGSTWHVDHR